MAFKSDLMGIPVATSPSAVPNADASRGYERRDYFEHPTGGTGYAAPFNIAVMPRPEIKERIEELERTKSRLFDLCEQKGVKPLDQGFTNTCWANGVTDAVMVARLAAGMEHVPLSSASVAGPATEFSNWRGRPAGVGGWALQAAKYGQEHGWAPSSLWPNADLNPNRDTPETRAAREPHKIKGWLDLPQGSWEALWTCVLLGYACPVAHMEWRHLTDAITLGISSRGEIMTLVRNSGHGRDKTGHTWLPESFGRPDEAIAVRFVTAS